MSLSRKSSQEDKSERRPSEASSNGDVANEELETYVVKDGDSLNRIAAMHDTTPSKLAQVNKMGMSRFIFPGQVLKLPAPEPPPKAKSPPPKPDKDVIDLANNFARIDVKHITDGRGIVEGTILLTSKLLMFDPCSCCPLVTESGVDKYQIVLPMHFLANAVILKEYERDSDAYPSLLLTTELEESDPDSEAKSGTGEAKSTAEAQESESEKENTDDNEQHVLEQTVYMRIRMGQPLGSTIKRDEMINTYGEPKVLPDYWFIISLERAKQVYKFWHKVNENFRIYGVLDLMAIERHGLDLVREGRPAVEPETGKTASRATVAKLDKSRVSFASVDFSAIAPMQGTSELMSKEEHIYLAKIIPAKLECYTWILTFTTTEQGFSLQNMMRRLSEKSGPLLLVLSDVKDNVFGAYLSAIPSIGESFEGTGETFLFKLRPNIKSFSWTGENNFFFRVDNKSLIVGSSRGKFGLWVDRDLNNGRSQTCATFDNEPLAGGSEEFILKTLECWTFDML